MRESHPEVVFACLAGGRQGLDWGKKTAEGQAERQVLLRQLIPEFDAQHIRAVLGRSAVALDDVIDAAACLLAAYRISCGRAIVLPCDRIEYDRRGLRMEIVA